MKNLSVLALLFATVYAAPTIRQRLGQVKETKLAQVEDVGADCGCGCPAPAFPTFDEPDEQINGGAILGSVNAANYDTYVNYNL